MRAEYVLNFFFLSKFDHKGDKLRKFTHTLRMFLDICFINAVSNKLMCLTNGFEKKVRFQVFKIYMFLLFTLLFKVIKWIQSFYPKSETSFKTVLFPEIIFSSPFKAQNCLETCVHCV